jgi:flagellar protein FlaF
MYQYSYSDILADSPVGSRMQEREALDHAIRLLRVAATCEPQGPEEGLALSFVNQLWAIFIKDLSSGDNDLPGVMRAQLMSIGLWIMAEAQRVELGESRSLAAMADVCTLVRDGLN